jgi:hypothetical protein
MWGHGMDFNGSRILVYMVMTQFHALLILLRGTKLQGIQNFVTLNYVYMTVSPCSSFQYRCKARNRHNITHKHAVVFRVMIAYILASHYNHFGEI